MMRFVRVVVAIGAVGLLATGCLLSAQILISFSLPNTVFIYTIPVSRIVVDLNQVGDYVDNKDKLDDVSDMALLGRYINNRGSDPLTLVVWMTPADQGDQDAASVPNLPGAVQVWGPLSLNPGQTTVIDWDKSAALFSSAGKTALINEIKGDGAFALYVIGTVGVYDFAIEQGSFVVTLDAK